MSDLRRAQLAAIHIAKKQLRLDDLTYRFVVARVSAQFRREPVASSALMTDRERGALLDELRSLGFRRVDRSSAPRSPAAAQVAKIQAVWNALAESGALRDSSEKALRAFIARQTGGVAMPHWLTAAQANKVIEGLKAWHRRVDGDGRLENGKGPREQ